MPPPPLRWRQVVAREGVPSVLVGAAVGRSAYGAVPVAVFLALTAATGSFRTAAAVAAVHGLVGAVSFPLKGRLVDARGGAALLVLAAATAALLTASLAVAAGRTARRCGAHQPAGDLDRPVRARGARRQ